MKVEQDTYFVVGLNKEDRKEDKKIQEMVYDIHKLQNDKV